MEVTLGRSLFRPAKRAARRQRRVCCDGAQTVSRTLSLNSHRCTHKLAVMGTLADSKARDECGGVRVRRRSAWVDRVVLNGRVNETGFDMVQLKTRSAMSAQRGDEGFCVGWNAVKRV
jgi:hypothetical protein